MSGRSYEQTYPQKLGEVLVNIFLDLKIFSFSLFHLHLNFPGTLGTFLDMQTPGKSLNDPIINKGGYDDLYSESPEYLLV